jgi:hypothetical protein
MDVSFSLDTASEFFTVESEDAAGLEAKVNALFALLAAAQGGYAIHGIKVAGAGAGGTWLALVSAKEDEQADPPVGTVAADLAAFVCVEQEGNTGDMIASFPNNGTTGTAFQAHAIAFVLDNFPDGSTAEVFETVDAGNNAGKRYLVGALLEVSPPPT